MDKYGQEKLSITTDFVQKVLQEIAQRMGAEREVRIKVDWKFILTDEYEEIVPVVEIQIGGKNETGKIDISGVGRNVADVVGSTSKS